MISRFCTSRRQTLTPFPRMRSKVTRMDGIMGPTGAGLDKDEDILPSNSDMVGAWRTSMAQRLAYNVKNLTSKFSCREGP